MLFCKQWKARDWLFVKHIHDFSQIMHCVLWTSSCFDCLSEFWCREWRQMRFWGRYSFEVVSAQWTRPMKRCTGLQSTIRCLFIEYLERSPLSPLRLLTTLRLETGATRTNNGVALPLPLRLLYQHCAQGDKANNRCRLSDNNHNHSSVLKVRVCSILTPSGWSCARWAVITFTLRQVLISPHSHRASHPIPLSLVLTIHSSCKLWFINSILILEAIVCT